MVQKKKDDGDSKSLLVLIALVAIGIVGTFWSGMVFGRNYRSAPEGFLKRFGVLFILIPCACLNAFVFAIFLPTNEMETYQYGPISIYREDSATKQEYETAIASWETRKKEIELKQQEWDQAQAAEEARAKKTINRLVGAIGFGKSKTQQEISPRPVFDEDCPVYTPVGTQGIQKPKGMIEFTDDNKILMTQESFLGLCASVLIFGSGCCFGMIQRVGRKHQFTIAAKNIEFLATNNLSENSDGTLVDTVSGQVFRVEDEDNNKITLFPKGTRNKRAYIYTDGDGTYTEFSGITKA